jgi:hypothetical protein
MDINIRYRILHQPNAVRILRRVSEGVTQWLNSSTLPDSSKGLSILVTDDKNFADTYEADVIVLISEKAETVPQNMTVAVFEDVPERLCEALQKLEHVHTH